MSNAPISINLTVTSTSGAQVTSPANINATLINYVSMNNPGYTVLPAGLIEDISSTCTYGIALIDSLVVDFMNSFTPISANPWLLTQQGNLVGVAQGQNTNTSVYVVFSGPPGFIVAGGFTVSDGIYQYIVQDGGIIPASGQSSPLFCVANQAGTWAVPVNTVTVIATQLPVGVTLTCTNPQAGTPGAASQSEEDYREQVLQAWGAAATAFETTLKTNLANVPGVQPRLISVAQINAGGWEVICGGGDPYQVAYAIFTSGVDISTLQGSITGIVSATQTNPVQITTDLNHGFTTGQTGVHITGATGMTSLNNTWTVTVVSPTVFTVPLNATSLPAYTGNGVVTPNTRTITANVNSYPNTYTIPFVNPPEQTVTVQLTWNAISPNVVSPTNVAQLAAPAVANYINSIPVSYPINIFELNTVFTTSISTLVDPQFVDRMLWTISINGISTPPAAGTGAVYGDPESYFFATSANITISQA